jgi:uncharacterized membrane protein
LKQSYTLLLCLLLTACGGTAARHTEPAGGADGQQNKTSPGTLLVYECNDYEFVARRGTNEMALWLEDRYVVLPLVASDSGTVYENSDVSLWSNGDETMLTLAGQDYQNCHLHPQRVPWEEARRRGVEFRGAGNEPDWYLEIQGNRLFFVGQYGTTRIMVPDAVVESVGPARAYRGAAGTQKLQVDIVDEPCADSRSGEKFPSRVTVTVGNTAHQGCGEALDYPWENLE